MRAAKHQQPDRFCEWCRLWEERLWRGFVLLSTALTLLGALFVAAQHLPWPAPAHPAPAEAISSSP